MARTGGPRRRRPAVVLLVAALATLLVLLFARDVSRAGHGATTPRRSENLSFAALANQLVGVENDFDGHLAALLAHGATLSRPVFDARLVQLADELPGWSASARQLEQPDLAHRVNVTLADDTEERVTAYQSLLADVAGALSLPWTAPATVDASPVTTLVATAEAWNRARFALVKEPGHAHLDALSSVAAVYYRTNGDADLVGSTSLRLVREISVAAIQVDPTPLPAPSGELLLPPVTSVYVGLSVANRAFAAQPVEVTVHVVPTNHLGVPFGWKGSAVLGPLGAHAFHLPVWTTAARERAVVTVRVSGAGGAPTAGATYTLVLSPSGGAS